MASIRINDIDLYYEVHGSGSPLVLIAGLASDSQSWLPVIQGLSNKHQIIVFDNRGCGRTKPMDAEISIQKITNDLLGLINALGLKEVKILGHSMGGFVAMDMALRYPDLVSDLLIAASSPILSKRNISLFNDWQIYLDKGMSKELWFKNMFYWIFTKTFFEDTNALNEAVRMSVNYPYTQSIQAFKNQVSALKNFVLTKEISEIKAKTLAIIGEQDIIFTPDEIYSGLKEIPGVKFSFVEAAAHSIHMEQPLAFMKIVEDFLEMT